MLSALAALWLGLPAQAADALREARTARVEAVIDGDTVRIEGGRLVRYIGIDAPETRRRDGGRWVVDPQPFAKAATAENRRRVAGQTGRLEFDRRAEDRYGRLLAYVWMDGEMVNEALVRAGLARARRYPPNLRYQGRLEAAQDEAKSARRGLWGSGEDR